MQKRQLTLRNGETYSYFEQGSGNKVLILIHGNLSSSVYFQPLLNKIPTTIRTIAMDLRGFGDSTYNKPVETLQDLAIDVNQFLEALNIQHAHILGWSLGGGVAMEFAATYPDKTDSLILLNSTTHKGYPVFKKDASFKPIIGQVYPSKEEMAQDPVQVAPVLAILQTQNAAYMTQIYDYTIYSNHKPTKEQNDLWITETLKQRNLVDVDFALASLNMSDEPSLYAPGNKRIHQIKAPVLHLWGTLDRTVPEYMVLENIKALEKQSKYIRYEACGHSPIIDRLDDLTHDILDFIA